MKTLKSLLVLFIIASNGFVGVLQAQRIKPKEVSEIMQKVADWQIEHINDIYSDKPEPHHPLAWHKAALYVGMVKWAAMAETDAYYEWLRAIGEEYDWQLHERMYHADDHAVGQMYADLYRKYGDEKMLKPTKQQFSFIMMHPSLSVLTWETPYHKDRWNWCDALFMSPPVWAKLYNITGEKTYLDFFMKEFKTTTDFLFDVEESLFYRDERFKTLLDNGTKVFWARGNGWVFAGLVEVMNELDPASEEYKYFLNIYKKMAEKLLSTQTPQGHWAVSLLGQEFYPTPETSGSSFFIYGLTWGINNGILKESEYKGAVKRGWNAMVSHVAEEGYLGYVQPVGSKPGETWPDKTEVYGTGAFLCAGSEVYKLFGGK